MSSQLPNKRKQLKVMVSFETSRLADECLASAYEQVVPLVSRATPSQGPSASVETAQAQPAQEKVSGFDSLDCGYCDSVTNSNRRAVT